MEHWQNIRQVVIVGLGITGLSVVKHLTKTQPQIQLKVIDTRVNPPGKDQLPPTIELHSGSWNSEWLAQADLVVTNPGIALANPEIQTVITNGTPVVGDIELFAWAVTKPVVAITGSNGKSTVTDLTGELAKAAGLTVAVGGNIGVPALDLLALDADLYVLELSCFQLETTSSLKLKAAAYLNLSEDHMDRYQGMDDYGLAKQRIFAHAETAIVNREDQATYPNLELYPQFSELSSAANGTLISFGTDDLEFGLCQHQGSTWLSLQGAPLLSTNELALVGTHNYTNVLVALALLSAVGIDYFQALNRLKTYNGLTHRCQVVSDNQGITWVNDSKATNLASTVAALSGLSLQGRLFLLVGGDSKGADVSPLQRVFARLNMQLFCFGRDAQAFMSLHESAQCFATMAESVAAIAPQLTTGDMVMLSPACASLDQFSNFMARGDAFVALAKQYAK